MDDSVPEVNESFDLNLVSAVSTDGTVSSTPTSGASIKSDASKCNVTILANDNPNGVFQIMASRPNGTGFISPLSVPQSFNVPEEIGRVNLYVVRAQGVQGTYLIKSIILPNLPWIQPVAATASNSFIWRV